MHEEMDENDLSEELDDRLRRHLRRRLDGELAAAPSFQATLAAAQRRMAQPRRRVPVGTWLVPATAVLLMLWLWWPQPGRIDDLASPETLLAELTSGTSWQAPSDRWLDTAQRPAYLGLPRLHDKRSVLEPPPLP